MLCDQKVRIEVGAAKISLAFSRPPFSDPISAHPPVCRSVSLISVRPTFTRCINIMLIMPVIRERSLRNEACFPFEKKNPEHFGRKSNGTENFWKSLSEIVEFLQRNCFVSGWNGPQELFVPLELFCFEQPNRGRVNGTRTFYPPHIFCLEDPFHSTRKMFEISSRFLVEWKVPIVITDPQMLSICVCTPQVADSSPSASSGSMASLSGRWWMCRRWEFHSGLWFHSAPGNPFLANWNQMWTSPRLGTWREVCRPSWSRPDDKKNGKSSFLFPLLTSIITTTTTTTTTTITTTITIIDTIIITITITTTNTAITTTITIIDTIIITITITTTTTIIIITTTTIMIIIMIIIIITTTIIIMIIIITTTTTTTTTIIITIVIIIMIMILITIITATIIITTTTTTMIMIITITTLPPPPSSSSSSPPPPSSSSSSSSPSSSSSWSSPPPPPPSSSPP